MDDNANARYQVFLPLASAGALHISPWSEDDSIAPLLPPPTASVVPSNIVRHTSAAPGAVVQLRTHQ